MFVANTLDVVGLLLETLLEVDVPDTKLLVAEEVLVVNVLDVEILGVEVPDIEVLELLLVLEIVDEALLVVVDSVYTAISPDPPHASDVSPAHATF